MRYVTPQEVLVLHARVLDESGGLHGVRDVGLLESACMRPQATFGGKQLYNTLFQKTAVLFESLARNHAFLDGNKRTAVTATAYFLHKNDYTLTATNKELVDVALNVATGTMEANDIADWLKKHSKKTK